MESSQPLSKVRRSKTLILALLCFVMAGFVMSHGRAAPERKDLTEEDSQGWKKVNLAVQDARPVAKAITMLEAMDG